MRVSSIDPSIGKFRYLAAALCLQATVLLSAPVNAADHHKESREHASHEHGVSKLKLAIDGSTLEMELMSPGADIVGFEHAAETPADRAAIKKAASLLRKGATLFAPTPAAQCRIVSVEVEAPSGAEKHDEKHHDDKHHGKHHDGDHKGAEKDTHSEFHAHYRFACKKPQELTHIDVKFFERFTAAREIEVEAITGSGQIKRELTPEAPRLKL
jgi:hypothetical protein